MLRLIFAVILLLLSLLCLFSAPIFILWYAEILVCEFPWIFSAITLLVLLWGFSVQRYAVTGSILALVALCIFLSPIVRAYTIGKSLDENLDSTLGKDTVQTNGKPFAFAKMITGISTPSVEY